MRASHNFLISSILMSVDHFEEDEIAMNRKTAAWESLPEGWDQKSLKSFWNSLTGNVKHKVTKCINQMKDHVTDPGAFCASLADRIEGKKWRSSSRQRASRDCDLIAKEIRRVARDLSRVLDEKENRD